MLCLMAPVPSNERIFDHDVRVLICDECGAPLPAPLDGGAVACQFCGATFDLAARAEVPLRGYRSVGLDEAKRLETLRKQDVDPIFAPPGLDAFVFGGSLVPGKIAEAEQTFRVVLRQAAAIGSVETENSLLFFARIIVDYHLAQRDYQRLRATLEAALEVARSPRARQILYAFLARSAARVGAVQAAEAWLAPCDARAQNLEMDTSYRVARAYVSTAKGDHQTALDVLGPELGAVPIQDTTECFASVLRANALEHIHGVDVAIAEVQRGCERGSFLIAAACVYNNPTLNLCPQSLALARRHVSLSKKSLVFEPALWISIYLAVVAALLFSSVRNSQLFTGMQFLALLVSFWALPLVTLIVRLNVTEFRRRRAAKSRAFARENAR